MYAIDQNIKFQFIYCAIKSHMSLVLSSEFRKFQFIYCAIKSRCIYKYSSLINNDIRFIFTTQIYRKVVDIQLYKNDCTSTIYNNNLNSKMSKNSFVCLIS